MSWGIVNSISSGHSKIAPFSLSALEMTEWKRTLYVFTVHLSCHEGGTRKFWLASENQSWSSVQQGLIETLPFEVRSGYRPKFCDLYRSSSFGATLLKPGILVPQRGWASCGWNLCLLLNLQCSMLRAFSANPCFLYVWNTLCLHVGLFHDVQQIICQSDEEPNVKSKMPRFSEILWAQK